MPDVSSHCASCGAVRIGPYCSACGQRRRDHRLTLRSVAADAIRHLTSFDRGLGRTVRDLAWRPSGLVADYWRGKTVPYTSPVRFFLIVVSVVQVAVFLLGIGDAIADGFSSYEGSRQSLDSTAVASRMRQFWVIGFAAIVPFALGWGRLVFHSSGRTLAEHAVAHLFFLGQLVFVWGLALSIGQGLYTLGLTGTGSVTVVALALGGLALYAWSMASTFGRRLWTGLIGGALVTMLAFASAFVALSTIALLVTA